MADIDKALTEVRKSVEIPGPEEQIEATEEIKESLPDAGETEITPTEDGGVEINFEPGAFNQAQSENHFDNLAELLPEDVLGPLGSELNQNYMDYKESRKEWEHTYITGLDLLGFKYEDRTEPFSGAAGATHPVLAEAVTQFQALAYKELLPADGPVRTQILGAPSPEKEMQSTRVKDFMNYQLMDQMKEYEPEFDQLLFYLPLAGSAFKKVYYDDLLGRAVSKFVPAEDLVVPYTATSLEDATAVVHRVKTKGNDLRKQMVGGFYRDLDIGQPGDTESDLERKERELEGITKTKDEDVYNILEFHIDLDLEGFEDRDSAGEETGIKLPYVVTIEEASREVLSIRRNYELDDPKKKKISYFVHFKFLPGLGFYGFGLPHIIGGMASSATSILRQLIDAGTLANLPAGFKARGIRVRDEAEPLQPGEFRDIDAPGGDLRASIIPLPFKEPSGTLLQLLGIIVESGKRFASVADMPLAEQNGPVGSTVAMLERGTKIMSAIHKRLHYAQKIEFNLLAGLFKDYLPPVYPYEVSGGDPNIKQADFDDRIDVMPVSDPNIFSTAQRIAIAQTSLQLIQSNPQVHGPAGMYEAYKRMYEALGVRSIEKILPPPPQPQPVDPGIENANALQGRGLQAFPKQDHQAHIETHLTFMRTPAVMSNINIIGILTAHIYEHVSLQAREIVEQEFGPQLQQLQEQYQGQIPPEVMQQIQMEIENEVAQRIAEMSAQMSEVLAPPPNEDPLVEIRQQELALQGAKLQQDAKEFETNTVIKTQQDAFKNTMAEQKNDFSQMQALDKSAIARERIDAQEEIAAGRIALELQKLQKDKTMENIDVERLRNLSDRN